MYTVPFWPSVQSHIMAEKTDHFKIHLNSKENLLAFSETKSFKIVNTWSKWYSTLQIHETFLYFYFEQLQWILLYWHLTWEYFDQVFTGCDTGCLWTLPDTVSIWVWQVPELFILGPNLGQIAQLAAQLCKIDPIKCSWQPVTHDETPKVLSSQLSMTCDWTLGQNGTVAEIPFYIENLCQFSNSVNGDYKLDSHGKRNKVVCRHFD